MESPESFLIEIPERKAQDILGQFAHDYVQIANNLSVSNKRLVLLNPKYIQARAQTVDNSYAGQTQPLEHHSALDQYTNQSI